MGCLDLFLFHFSSSLSLCWVICIAWGLMSIPMAFLPRSFASISVVPPPTKGSRMSSPFLEYCRIMFRGICGAQFPR